MLRAYQRTSVTEIHAEHRAYLDYWTKDPAVRDRTPDTLDFPQHPREALNNPFQKPVHVPAAHRPPNTLAAPARGVGLDH